MALTSVGGGSTLPISQNGNIQVFRTQVDGGTLFIVTTSHKDVGPTGVGVTFVTDQHVSTANYIPLASARNDDDTLVGPTAGSGRFGLEIGAIGKQVLVTEATDANMITAVATFLFMLPDSYVPGTDVVFSVFASIEGDGEAPQAGCTVHFAGHKHDAATDSDIDLTLGGSDTLVIQAEGDLLRFVIVGTDLLPGDTFHVDLEMTITSTDGSNSGQIASVSHAP